MARTVPMPIGPAATLWQEGWQEQHPIGRFCSFHVPGVCTSTWMRLPLAAPMVVNDEVLRDVYVSRKGLSVDDPWLSDDLVLFVQKMCEAVMTVATRRPGLEDVLAHGMTVDGVHLRRHDSKLFCYAHC